MPPGCHRVATPPYTAPNALQNHPAPPNEAAPGAVRCPWGSRGGCAGHGGHRLGFRVAAGTPWGSDTARTACSAPLLPSARDPGGTQTGPSRDPGGTRAHKGAELRAPLQPRRGALGRSRAPFCAPCVACQAPVSDTQHREVTAGGFGSMQGHLGVPSASGPAPGWARVPPGSRPGPARVPPAQCCRSWQFPHTRPPGCLQVLEVSWSILEHPGGILEVSWRILGVSWSILEVSWRTRQPRPCWTRAQGPLVRSLIFVRSLALSRRGAAGEAAKARRNPSAGALGIILWMSVQSSTE